MLGTSLYGRMRRLAGHPLRLRHPARGPGHLPGDRGRATSRPATPHGRPAERDRRPSCSEPGRGDTVTLVGRLDPQIAAAAVGRRLVVRGHRALALRLPGPALGRHGAAGHAAARPARRPRTAPRSSWSRPRDDARGAGSSPRGCATRFPELEVNSVADLVAAGQAAAGLLHPALLHPRQHEPVVTVLLIGTLLTITVNERLGEIATLRAIGVSRGTIVRQVLAEGVALTVIGRGARDPARSRHRGIPRRDPHQLSRACPRPSPSSCPAPAP